MPDARWITIVARLPSVSGSVAAKWRSMIVLQPTSGSDVDANVDDDRWAAAARARSPFVRSAMTLNRPPNIACIGVSDWDRLIAIAEYPEVGGFAGRVWKRSPRRAGPTTNTAVALARLGAQVDLATAVGDDERGATRASQSRGRGYRHRLAHGQTWSDHDPGHRDRQPQPLERTIFVESRARSLSGEISSTSPGFSAAMCWSLDVADVSLRRFLLDLPAHTVPTTRLLGPLTYLADKRPA